MNRNISNFYDLLKQCANVNAYLIKINVRQKAQSVRDEHPINKELKEIIDFKATNNSSWIAESKVNSLCLKYNKLNKDERAKFLTSLATQYAVDHDRICQLAKRLACNEPNNPNQLIARERALKDTLTPPYHWLFTRVGRLEHGVKFLVDLRANVLDIISQSSKDSDKSLSLGQMDVTLKELLFFWFSVGFLKLERVTWQTPCDILQKVSDYEAIHPIKNWADLKKRVGPYRRCFIFTHPSMPREPLVVLHTALCDIIPDTVKGIQEAEHRILGQKQTSNHESMEEDKNKIKTAIFYSISSTQVGLQGIELGNYLIKEVAKQITSEFPMIDQLSSLSPIPNFRLWLLDRMKRDINTVFTKAEQDAIRKDLDYDNATIATRDLYLDLKKIFNNSLWSNDKRLTSTLREPLLRACAWYLYREKRRNYALNNVANFHLRNGAVMWRINWLADPSPRGMANSCGIMVNYRYFLDETESNSRNYIEKYQIKASNTVIHLAKEAEKYFTTALVSVK
ncbi:malonyl-CoA decarboxylase, mitochondrial-like [Phymastichus coffea]|uniref:malonyl-CoA decarboxylase, mitochondrial-like n=1 Tax=Phymastichus coffea TaxID=108790 RepID=UPI00273ADE8B|nr:malonyl-CoA decarboxylase, mitochondrial-like [Phymastichus coffea]XP_058809043.1 malonyl-CoA decarboxylase, mitochondrial-like [Phymastichus coffea]